MFRFMIPLDVTIGSIFENFATAVNAIWGVITGNPAMLLIIIISVGFFATSAIFALFRG